MNPFAILLILFLVIPIVEIYLLIKVGGVIGAMWTVVLVVFTAVLGAWLLRIQGFSTLRRVQNTLAEGGIPAFELLEGLILLIAGALLLTPGFFTDAIGFLCLIPMLRRQFLVWISSRFMMPGVGKPGNAGFYKQSEQRSYTSSQRRVPPRVEPKKQSGRKPPHEHTVIEGEFERENDDKQK